MTFHVMVSVYRLVKIWNSPQFPAEFQNSLLGQSRAGRSEPVSFHHPAAMFVSKHQQDLIFLEHYFPSLREQYWIMIILVSQLDKWVYSHYSSGIGFLYVYI